MLNYLGIHIKNNMFFFMEYIQYHSVAWAISITIQPICMCDKTCDHIRVCLNKNGLPPEWDQTSNQGFWPVYHEHGSSGIW